MDPRMRQVLLTLLQMMVEQQQQDPLAQPAPPRRQPYPPGTLGYDLKQLSPYDQHRVWPIYPEYTSS